MTGDTKLAFSANPLAATMTPEAFKPADLARPTPPVEIAPITSDVPAAFDKAVAAGAAAVKRPEQKSWDQMVGYVRDLDGSLIEICSPIES